MKVKIDELRQLMLKIVRTNGLKGRAAKLVVDDYLEGELLGKISHGIFSFPKIIAKIEATRGIKIKIIKNKPSFALIDARGGLGAVVAEQARKLLITKAKKQGIAMVGIQNVISFLRPGTQAEKIAEEDLIGLVFNNGGREKITHPGAKEPTLPTNPIGFSIPTSKYPITADMATSTRAWFETSLAEFFHHALPANAFLDKNVKFTRNPKKAESCYPVGGYKGFNIAFLFEVLTTSLIGWQRKASKDFRTQTRGTFLIAIDPRKFTSLKKFKQENTKLVNKIKRAKRKTGVKEILVAGDRSRRNKELALKRGWLEIDKRVYNKIKKLDK